MQTPENSTTSGRINPALLIFLALPLLGIAAALMMLANNPTTLSDATATLRPAGIMNKPAPELALTALDGSPVSLDDFKGRTVFINFWWTGCPPCVKELPAFQEFAEQQKTVENGAVVLAVNSAETPEQINKFFAENSIQLNDVYVLLDMEYEAIRAYGVVLFPTTYIVSPDGIITNARFGEMTVEEMSSYLMG